METFRIGAFRYRLYTLNASSDRYGNCEVCKGYVDDVHCLTKEQEFFYQGEKHYTNKGNLFGHEECLKTVLEGKENRHSNVALEEVLVKMRECSQIRNTELRHKKADKLLMKALKICGEHELVAIFDGIYKEYKELDDRYGEAILYVSDYGTSYGEEDILNEVLKYLRTTTRFKNTGPAIVHALCDYVLETASWQEIGTILDEIDDDEEEAILNGFIPEGTERDFSEFNFDFGHNILSCNRCGNYINRCSPFSHDRGNNQYLCDECFDEVEGYNL